MTELSRGANAGLAGTSLEVAVSGARQGSVDLMIFQLGSDRKVRSDADFIFFNQPASPEGAIRLAGADRVDVDLAGIPPEIDTLAVAVAMDDSAPGSLAAIAGLGVSVRSSTDQHQAITSGLTTERAAVLVEMYRRAGGWKVRNVSAGWTAGLPALAREHGVTVDEAPSPAPASAPAGYPSPTPVGMPLGYPQGVAADLLPPAVLPAYSSAANAPASSAAPAGWRPPGGFTPPGGSLPPPAQQPAPSPGGWPPPGGDLRPVNLPPPTATPGGWPPPGGSLR